MTFVTNYWYIWLTLSMLTLFYGGYNQIRRMKKMMRGDTDTFSEGLYLLLLTFVLNSVFSILFIISIVLICLKEIK